MSRTTEFHIDFLKEVLANGGGIVSARFSLQRGFLKSVDPRYVLTLQQNGVRSLQELAWTPELETYLLFEVRVRTSSTDEEAERFAAILLNNLETAEIKFGRDYARSVLVEILRERPEYHLEEWLSAATSYKPSHAGAFYGACLDFLRHSIDGLQNTAHLMLKYSADAAVSLLAKALSIVLDEIFHISSSRALFPS